MSNETFERFAMIGRIRSEMAAAAARGKFRSILLVDVGKNILPFWLAARGCGLKIVAVADEKLARRGRKYRGVPVVDDATARRLKFDAAVLTNISPVHGPARAAAWRGGDPRPLVELCQAVHAQALAA